MEGKSERIRRIREEISRLSNSGYDLDQVTQLREELMMLKTNKQTAVTNKSHSKNKDSKKTRKTKSGAKMSSYQVHVADCRGGKGKFEGQGTKDFEQCVEIWNNLKKNTGD